MLSAVTISVQASAQHAAKGIISDELWEMINDRLEAADSPRLDLDSTMMGNTIVTTVEVDTPPMSTMFWPPSAALITDN
jgi:hypothetical protein